jgi:hypothetical protein
MNLISYYIVPGLTICDLLAIIKKYFSFQGLMQISLRPKIKIGLFAVGRPTLQNWGRPNFFLLQLWQQQKFPFYICGKSGFLLFQFDPYFIVTGTCSWFSEVLIYSVQLSGKSIEMIRINQRHLIQFRFIYTCVRYFIKYQNVYKEPDVKWK